MQSNHKTLLRGLAIAITFAFLSLPVNGAKEVHPIPLSQDPSGSSENEGAPRSLVSIMAFYDTDLFSVGAYLSNAGAYVDVSIVNQTTNETYNYQISGTGSSVMPISGTPGYWSITFTLSGGDEYMGSFEL